MVLQGVAEIVLSRLLDKVFYGISKQNIQVAILDGKFVLSNIGLQPSLLAQLNLPVELKYSYVERVEIHLPWRADEVSLTINISNIYLLVATQEYTLDLFDIFMKRKERIIEQALKEFKSNLERDSKKESGMFEKLFLNLLDNVNIKIECIHLRGENRMKNYSFGIKINEVSARTVNQEDQPCFFNREKTKDEYVRYIVEMDFMGIYFNSKEDYYLSTRSLAQITDEFNRLSHKRYPNYSENSEQGSDNFNYILTISLKTVLKKYINVLDTLAPSKDEKYQFVCAINLNKIQSKISDQQYYDLLDIINLISDYRKVYLDFVNRIQLINYKDRKAKDISDLLRKKKSVVVGKREKETIKRHCRKYMSWVFKHAYEEVMKRKFIKEAIKKEVNVKNLKNNSKTSRIMTKIDNEKLKLWVLISLYYRKKYEEKVSVFLRGSLDKQAVFAAKYIDSHPLFSPYEFEEEINRQRELSGNKYQVFLKLVANIQEFNFQISRENNLGVYFNLQKLKAQLILREKNYLIKLFIQDLQADVFHCSKHQKLKTNVPIIKRNCILDRTVSLLQITYQRNPVGKPFVFTEIEARIESIQITIYPQAFKQFYEILLGDEPVKKKRKTGKRQEVESENRPSVRQIGFQKTIIKGKIKTPWIVLPLSPINNLAQECWVARFGDFYIDTPEHDYAQVKTEEEIFYEQYKLQLKRFELSYFSSINFFYNWLKFNYSLQSLSRIKSFANEKIITMIEPFSCFVDFSLLKSSLSPAIRDKKAKMVGKIMIDEIRIRASKFLMSRLKSKVDNILDQGAELDEFIESNVRNIKEENDLSGYCRVSYEGIKKINFYCILKGSYMYFFIHENHHKYHFFVNITDTALRLVSNDVENFNTDRNKLLCLYLGEREKHLHWRKKILHNLNKKMRKMDTTTNSFRHTSSEQIRQDVRKSEKEDKEESENHSSLKLNMTFLMNKLSIQLFDEKDALFLDCNFKKAKLEYSNISEKSLKFSLNEWTVCEGDGNLFIGSNSFFQQQVGEEDVNNLNNFLEVCCGFNSITEQLKVIEITVDKLFLAWKVELFTRILLFFFYDQAAADAPTPMNLDKRELQIKISFQKFSFYCYFAAELLALTKLQFINIRYFQNNLEEIYDVNCKVFEMDKYVNGQREKRVPMIRRRQTHQEHPGQAEQLVYNNFNLSYLLRKRETQEFANICRLKKRFGEEILVSQILCDWKDTEIYFQSELTFRLLNYILNKVLGTVASKFKKREYSSNYIFESLKMTKLSAFDIVLSNCLFRMPPHDRGFREYSIEADRLRFTKNIDESFMPNEMIVKTINLDQRFFWQAMVIKISKAQVYYHVGRQPPIPILAAPININLIYSKMNFQREYFVILNHHDDIDRKATMDVIIEEPVIVEAHKIMFVTFLQLFYQNIKHKDGKADIFETPLPFPSLREYSIYIQKVGLNMYYFHERNNSMQSFSRFLIDRFKVNYKQVGQESTIRLEGETLHSTGELPIYSIDPKRKKFVLDIASKEGEMKVVINVEYFALQADLDRLNNIIQFINYDNDYVSNKIMVKKSSSWQYVNVFAKNCQLRLGDLRVEGQFYISYLKGMKNDPEIAAKEYLLTQQAYNVVRNDASKLNWDDITDKEIKVNGEDIRLSIGGDRIGAVSSFFFNRNDLTCKSTNKRFKKERVQVGEGALHIQMVDLLTIWQVYNTYIKKKSNFELKTLYQPWDQLPAKLKVVEKRATEVEIQRLAISILPTREVDILRYLRIDLSFPSIIYRTFKDEQEVLVNIVFKLWNHKQRLREVSVGECKSLRIRYLNFKDRKEKSIDIVHGKGVVINLDDFNSRTIYSIIQEAAELKKTTRNNLHVDLLGKPANHIIYLKNESSRRLKINLSNAAILSVMPFQEQQATVQIQTFLEWASNPKSFIQIHQDGSQVIRRTAAQINLYSANLITATSCLIVTSTPKLSRLTYKPIYSIKNFTSCNVCLKDKRILKPGDCLSFIPNKLYLDFDIRSPTWSRQCSLYIKKEEESFGDDCFIALFKKDQEGLLTVQLYDKFSIKNTTHLTMTVGQRQILPSQEISLGYVPKSQRNSFPIRIQNDIAAVNLLDSSHRIKYSSRILDTKSKHEEKLAIDLRVEIQTVKKISIIVIFSELTVRNLTNESVLLCLEKREFAIRPNETIALPSQFKQAKYRQSEDLLQLVFNKNKQFFGKQFKFTQVSRLEKKATTIKIESKHSIRNNTSQTIDIEVAKDMIESIAPSQTYQLTSTLIKQQKVTLIFGKYDKKQIRLDKPGINFLQIEQRFYKLTMLSKDESILIIQDSKGSHKIINKLDNISIIAHTYDQPKENKAYSLFQINNDTNIQKLIKAGCSGQIGLFSWSNPQIELEFYLDAKNIEFKQKFKLNFDQLSSKFSYRHILHDEKDKKNVFFLVITVQKDSEGCFAINVYREKDFQSLPIEKMKVSVQEISLSFIISSESIDTVTFECYKASFTREKGIELTDLDIQVEKLLIRQGKNVSILSALGNNRFLNSHLILSKTAKGIGINNLIIKLAPLELIFREKIMFKVLQKIVDVRAQNPKRVKERELNQDNFKTRNSKFEETSLIRISPQATLEPKLQKHWESVKKQKNPRLLIINNLQLSETSVFVTYSKEEYKQFDEKIASDNIIKYMLLIPSISELKISIPHLKISEFTGEPKEFAKEVVGRLKQSIGSTIANSFSALPFFDNPIIVIDGLFKYIDGMLSIQ